MEESALIIGGGVSGLAAALDLARHGWKVTVLEARHKLGGRIHTVIEKSPIELGAEFVHGKENDTWEYLRRARLETLEVRDRQWQVAGGVLQEHRRFWEDLSKALERINPAAPDQDFQSFLDQAWSLDPTIKLFAGDYVEGFHAADTARISVHALAKAEAAAQRENGTHQFRILKGYSALVRWLHEQLQAKGAAIELNTVAKQVRWESGEVEVMASNAGGQRRFHANCAIVTLPLGVLQDKSGPGGVRFDPELRKDSAIRGLAMGSVCKLTLQFRERFWPVKNFGFIHSPASMFPTWWSLPNQPILTGWCGGPRAARLNRQTKDVALNECLRTLSEVFRVDEPRVRDLLIGSWQHNWDLDPFSRGAYSYVPARMSPMVQKLATPLVGTLFFAGETTAPEGDQGTVHGAIASGKRAAHEVRKMHRRRTGSSPVPARSALSR